MKRPRPFGLELLADVTPYVTAAALSVSVVAAGCSGNGKSSSSGSSVAPGTTAPIQSAVTMAYSMPSAQFPSGDTQ
jgi:hypothetical protein